MVRERLLSDTGTFLLSRADLPTTTTSCYVLRVADGPDKGKRFMLDGTHASRLLAGKSPACEVRLTDPSVSRRHVAFEVCGQRFRVTDLGSTNGTYVNGVSILDAYLDGGEFVRVGETTFHLQLVESNKPVTISSRDTFGRVVGGSEEMRRLYPLCERLAQSDVPVIIEGETGTGKEVLAESIHELGGRSTGPFVVFDCMAAPPNLLESALFGHEKGAFTGATSGRAGVFEQAHKGTLLIDEIGDLDISLQPKLLRAIQRMEVQRVGGSKSIKVDVRVLAATRRDLDKEVQAGRFRDDLFFRLNVARIELPPLRRRRGDIALLARHFWNMLGGRNKPIPHLLLSQFEDYSWPGNVRELHNTIARHLALGELAVFNNSSEKMMDGLAALNAGSDASGASRSDGDFVDHVVALNMPLSDARQQVVDEFERRYIEHALKANGGNVTKAAAASGVARRYFYLLRARQDKPNE